MEHELVIATFLAAIAAIGGAIATWRGLLKQNSTFTNQVEVYKKQVTVEFTLEIYKILNDPVNRQSRINVYEVYNKYKRTLDISLYDSKRYRTSVATVRASIDLVGSLLFFHQEYLPNFLKVWSQPVIQCYTALEDVIEYHQRLGTHPEYMKYFKWLNEQCANFWIREYGEENLPQVYDPRDVKKAGEFSMEKKNLKQNLDGKKIPKMNSEKKPSFVDLRGQVYFD